MRMAASSWTTVKGCERGIILAVQWAGNWKHLVGPSHRCVHRMRQRPKDRTDGGRQMMKRAKLGHRIVDVTPEQRAACEVVKLIRKLRWIGMEREAKELQMALSGFPSDKRASLVAGPHSTD